MPKASHVLPFICQPKTSTGAVAEKRSISTRTYPKSRHTLCQPSCNIPSFGGKTYCFEWSWPYLPNYPTTKNLKSRDKSMVFSAICCKLTALSTNRFIYCMSSNSESRDESSDDEDISMGAACCARRASSCLIFSRALSTQYLVISSSSSSPSSSSPTTKEPPG